MTINWLRTQNDINKRPSELWRLGIPGKVKNESEPNGAFQPFRYPLCQKLTVKAFAENCNQKFGRNVAKGWQKGGVVY